MPSWPAMTGARSIDLVVGLSILIGLTSPAHAGFERTDASLPSDLVPGPVEYAVLLPSGYDTGANYPLLLALHGGRGTRDNIERLVPELESAVAAGLIPPLVVAMPTVTPRSFYMDFRDGSEKWERFLVEEFLPHLRRTFKISSARQKTAVFGGSMGGMGALRVAFKHPELFGVTAALNPGIEPILTFDEMSPRHRFWRSDELFERAYGKPVDRAYWAANNPATIARDNAGAIRDSGLHILIEAGDEDVFLLHEGTEFLHRVLYDEGVRHEYHYYKWVDHGSDYQMRMRTILQFLGRALDPPAQGERVKAMRKLILPPREAVGIPPERYVPPPSVPE